MNLVDVNVLVYAFREDSPNHGTNRRWLERAIVSHEPFGVADLVLSGFLRIVTHPRIFDPPTPIVEALDFVRALRGQPNAVVIGPGVRHWDIFERLLMSAQAKGNLIPDAYLAALALESGSEWISNDRDFSRFEGLRWRTPDAEDR